LTRRFSTLILHDEPWTPDTAQLVDIMNSRFAALGETVAIEPEEPTEAGLALFEIASRLIAVERVAGPMAHAPLDAPVQPERAWDPAEAVAGHGAYLRIADLDPAEDAAARRLSARIVTMLAGVLGRMSKTRAVYYPHSGALLPENEALRAAHMVLGGVSPIEAWTTIYPIGAAEADPALAHGACTHGLDLVLGREIELAPAPMAPRKALDRLYGAVWQALDGEDGFADGMEWRDAEGRLIATVRAVPGFLRPDVPAFVLVAPDAVVDAKRLRLRRGVDPEILRCPVPRPAEAAPDDALSA